MAVRKNTPKVCEHTIVNQIANSKICRKLSGNRTGHALGAAIKERMETSLVNLVDIPGISMTTPVGLQPSFPATPQNIRGKHPFRLDVIHLETHRRRTYQRSSYHPIKHPDRAVDPPTFKQNRRLRVDQTCRKDFLKFQNLLTKSTQIGLSST